ncbi:MAG: DUF4115 domain-containing protein [Leptospira sp.]|nr:DUF4115 domain-containing protein [Leptospira sp.]
MLQRRVGQILRDAREEKRLAVKEVSKDTNISVKFILALENEDYAQFPGETFALGFLKNYSDYLKTDTAQLINLYKGEQIEESQVPLEELTRPTSASIQFDRSKVLTAAAVIILAIAAYIFIGSYDNSDNAGNDTISNNAGEVSEVPRDLTFVNQSVPENTSVPFILTSERGVSFSVNNQLCNMFIKSVKEATDPAENVAVIGFNITPERKVYLFESKVGGETILNYNIPELSILRREIRIINQAVTGKSAKVLVTLSDEKVGAAKKPVGDIPIQVTLFFQKSSYLEYIIDGQSGERGLVSAGDSKQLEAKDRMEIKVGDGGAVEMIQNGKEKVKLGKPGKLVKKVFYKVPSLYDSTQFVIKELGE